MTAEQWLASNDPAALLAFARGHDANTAEGIHLGAIILSDRKLRLFAVACCRLCADTRRTFTDEYERDGVHGLTDAQWASNWCQPHIVAVSPDVRAALLRDIFGNPFRQVRFDYFDDSKGNHTHVFPDPPWLSSTVVSLAKRIYDERAFERMPYLGDALEDAGCTDEAVLRHCRGEERCHTNLHGGEVYGARKWRPLRGQHARGCWVVDLILGKA